MIEIDKEFTEEEIAEYEKQLRESGDPFFKQFEKKEVVLPWIPFDANIPIGKRMLLKFDNGNAPFCSFGIVERPSIGEPGKYCNDFLIANLEHTLASHDITEIDLQHWFYIDNIK